jgi:hypothetical protein
MAFKIDCFPLFDALYEPEPAWEIPSVVSKKSAVEALSTCQNSQLPNYASSLRCLVKLSCDTPYQVFRHSRSHLLLEALLQYLACSDICTVEDLQVSSYLLAKMIAAGTPCTDPRPSLFPLIVGRWHDKVFTVVRDHHHGAPFAEDTCSSMTWCNPGQTACTCGLLKTAGILLYACSALSTMSTDALEMLRVFCKDVLPYVAFGADGLYATCLLGACCAFMHDTPGVQRLFRCVAGSSESILSLQEQMFIAKHAALFAHAPAVENLPNLVGRLCNTLATGFRSGKARCNFLQCLQSLSALSKVGGDRTSSIGSALLTNLFDSGIMNSILNQRHTALLSCAFILLEGLDPDVFEATKANFNPHGLSQAVTVVLIAHQASFVRQHARWLSRVVDIVCAYPAGDFEHFFECPDILKTIVSLLEQWSFCKNERLYVACYPQVLDLLQVLHGRLPTMVLESCYVNPLNRILGRLSSKTPVATSLLGSIVHARAL